MRKDIIQSKTEPNKNNIWLSEEGLKKYGKNGWETLGGGVSPNTPIVDTISGNELIPVNQNGENKAVRADELIKGGKEVFIITTDMFVETATVAGQPSTLTFTDEGWSAFIEAAEANKIIALDHNVIAMLINSATPMVTGVSSGYFILTGLDYYSGIDVVNGYISFLSMLDFSSAVYQINFENKNVYSIITSTPSEVYHLNFNDYSTAEDFTKLHTAINNGNVIIANNLPIIQFSNAAVYNVNSITNTSITLMCVSSRPGLSNGTKTNITYDTILITFTSDGGKSYNTYGIAFDKIGDGTKFLSNDGTYKEVSGGDNTFVATLSSKYADIKSAIDAKKQILFDDENGGIFTCNYSVFYSNIYLYYKGNYETEEHPVTTFIKYESSGTIVGPYVADKTTIRRTISTNNANNYLIPSVYYIDTITANTRYALIASSAIYEQTGEAACFEGQIIFGSTVYTINFYINDSINSSSSGIKWSTDSVLEYKANHTYQFRIVNGLGVMKEFANA